MNDKLIINSISKMYFTIISFFVFIFLALSVTYLILSNGVYLKELSFSSLHINKLYIKWDKNLNISIDNLTILAQEDAKPIDFESKDIRKYLKKTGLIASFIQSVVIRKINYRDIKATLKYVYNEGGYIRASSSNFNVNTIIHKTKHYINFEILDLTDSIKKIYLHGNIILDLLHREMLVNLNTKIDNEIDANIYTYIDAKQLKYAIKSNKDIKSYTHLISILDVDSNLKYWIYDAIDMKYATLKKAYGFIDFSKPQEVFDNLYVSINLNKLNYSYHNNIDSIHTQDTLIEFKDGFLNIIPKEHTTYDFDLDRSWLKIDFNKKNAELTLYLLLNGFVDKNLLHILKTFGITLPFKQNSGSLETDLTLVINLNSLDVDAEGNFFTKKANFTYLGLDLDIFNANIHLKNYNIKIDKMFTKYKGNIAADITASLDTKNDEGLISFDIKEASFNDKMLSLDTDTQLHIDYKISSGKDSINISKSEWLLFSKEHIYINSLDIPFDYENLFATIPTTQIKIENIATIYSSGSISFKTLNTNFELDLANFKYDNIELTQSNTLLDLSFIDSKLTISSDEQIEFTFMDLDSSVYKPRISFYNQKMFINSSKFTIDNLLESELALKYSFKNSNGYLNMKKIKFQNEDLGIIFEKDNFLGFKLKNINDDFTAFCSDMDILISSNKDKWSIALNSIESLHKHSELLQKYDLDDGDILIYKQDTKKDIFFKANINHNYKFLSINNELVSEYKINGLIDDNTGDVKLNINKKVDVLWGDRISINGSNIGINLNAITEFIASTKDEKHNSKSKYINLELLDSYVYFSEDRRAISDKISLQYYNNIATAQLNHKGATAGFKLQDNNFFLYGENFNDKFMENLFALSKFKGGDFDFSIKGSLEEFVGILYLKDTTVIEYKLLNNILAFVNTIPSLVTFSLPGYNDNGLKIDNAYVNFSYKNNQYKFKDIYLDSKEMKIIGKGQASYKYNTIDLNLNLKTDLGSTVSKIPVVGYIIFDEDSISTSLKVSGKLNDPEVESMIAKDIIVAPLNIIKRTLLFPFKIFE